MFSPFPVRDLPRELREADRDTVRNGGGKGTLPAWLFDADWEPGKGGGGGGGYGPLALAALPEKDEAVRPT